MSLANPILSSWSYDFGEYTRTQLVGQAAPSINTILADAKTQAQDMINSGAYGSTTGVYRVIVRADAQSPQGYSVEIRLVTV